MQEVTLDQMLRARENRVHTQQALLRTHGCPLICFTMNIAGPVKTSPLIQRGFRAGLAALEQQIPKSDILEQRVDISSTGCQAFLSVAQDAGKLKALCTAIEESSPLGRLFDMDILDQSSKKLSRPKQRSCIVCGAPGHTCAAGRLHTVEQLQTATRQILQNHFALADSARIAAKAVESLINEVRTTPKPGLVDCRNSGSHTDMDMTHFVASAKALEPYFTECVRIGQDTQHLPPQDTFSLLRRAGLRAEQVMYQATGGVNTHKGAIYTMGVLCGSLGRLWTAEHPIGEVDAILSQCALITEDAVKADLSSVDDTTAGQRLYRKYGLTGIRGEAAAGFPSIARISLPVFQRGLDRGLALNDAGLVALLHLIAQVEDTNLYHRGGPEGAAYAAGEASVLLARSPSPTVQQLEELDDAFILRNLSPGGCADLLAATYFLYTLTASFSG